MNEGTPPERGFILADEISTLQEQRAFHERIAILQIVYEESGLVYCRECLIESA